MKEKTPKEKVNVSKLNTRATRIVYWVFQIAIIATMIASIVQLCVSDSQVKRSTQVSHIMLCAVALVLYNVPNFMQTRFNLYVPTAIHIFILIFIFAHFILGEVVGIYTTSAVFDKILHATSGFAIALCGFSLVNLFNSQRNVAFRLNPFFVAFFSFCFALAIALLWEIFEFAADSLFNMNMQRWNPPEEIKKAVAAGTMKEPKQGYGLVDTMQDVIVSTISALIVSVIGYFFLKRKKTLLNRFLLRKISDYDTAIAEAEEAGDSKLSAALVRARAEALARISDETDGNMTDASPLDTEIPKASPSEEAAAGAKETVEAQPGTQKETSETETADTKNKSEAQLHDETGTQKGMSGTEEKDTNEAQPHNETGTQKGMSGTEEKDTDEAQPQKVTGTLEETSGKGE